MKTKKEIKESLNDLEGRDFYNRDPNHMFLSSTHYWNGYRNALCWVLQEQTKEHKLPWEE